MVAAAVAGRVVAVPRRRPALLVAVLVLGALLLATTVGISAPGLGTALVPAAAAAGFVARLSAAELAALVPRARAAVLQALVAAGALAAGVAIGTAPGSPRAAFALGGGIALLAALPLLRLGAASPALVRAVAVRAALYAAATGVLLLLALVIHNTALLDLDTAALEALDGVGSSSGLIDSLFVAPSLRNYVIILAVVALVGARLWGRTTPLRTLLMLMGAGCIAYAGVRTCWALWERPRPEEVLDAAPVTGRSWAPYPSFPSGHMAVTMVLALMTGALVPKLRYVLWAYAAIIAFTRLSYGAHFPSDVLLGAVLGWIAFRVTITPLRISRE